MRARIPFRVTIPVRLAPTANALQPDTMARSASLGELGARPCARLTGRLLGPNWGRENHVASATIPMVVLADDKAMVSGFIA